MIGKKKYLSTDFISKILEMQIDTAKDYDKNSDEKRWLYLLASATGSGKSYSIASVMGKKAIDEDLRFVYVVHTRDNLRDIHQKLIQATPSVKDKVLLLKAEAEMIVDFFKQDHGKKTAFLDEFSAFTPLKEFITNMVLKENNKVEQLKAIRKHQDTIREYIGSLKKELRGYFQSLPKPEKEAFKKKVGLIFPTAYLKKYNIIFTTTRRFMYSVWQLQSSSKLYDMSYFNNHFVVIDEIDAQKQEMLKIIAEAAASEVIDKISLFAAIHHTLQASVANSTKGSDLLLKYGVKKEDAQTIIDFFDEIYEKYFERFNFVYKVNKDDNAPRYILKSDIASSITFRVKKLIIDRNDKNRINYVRVKGSEDKEKQDLLYFYDMIQKIDLALNRIIRQGSAIVIQAVAKKYDECKEKGEYCDLDEYAGRRTEDFIRDLEYSPEDDAKKFRFIKESMSHFKRLNRQERKKQLTTDAEDFYLRGYSVVEARGLEENDGYERMRSGFRFFSLLDTPEYILQAVASKMFIIGISATATIETVVKNFDLGYMRTSQVPVLSLSQEEIATLNRLYIEDNHQEHRPISVHSVGAEDLSLKQMCQQYFNGDDKAMLSLRRVETMLKDPYGSHEVSFSFKRYKKYLELYWHFITNSKISSFLLFVNKLSDKKKPDQSILSELFAMMILANRNNPALRTEICRLVDYHKGKLKNGAKEKLFFALSSESKPDYIAKIHNEILLKGGIAFVFTSYQTMGSGANIDYLIAPREIQHYTVLSNAHAERHNVIRWGEKSAFFRKRDYSAIYCELPTHIIPRSSGNDSTDSQDKFRKHNVEMLTLLYYVHALYVSSTTSFVELRNSLSSTLSGQFHRVDYHPQTDDYINAVMVYVIQAIGRCHRVNNPDDPLFIFVDNDILDKVANFDASNITLLPSVRKILEKAKSMSSNSGQQSRSNNGIIARKIERYSNGFNKKITTLLKYMRGNKDFSDEFISFREQILKHPTVATVEQNTFAALYTPPIDRKKYWYVTENDFLSVEARLGSGGDRGIEVSEESANLHLIRRMPELGKYFMRQNYALKFEHTLLPVPVAFNNFYKGILGEVIGAFIFSHQYGIKIDPLDFESGFFEFFDFVAHNGMMIDFKYYSTHTLSQTEEASLRANATRKLKTIGADRGMIVNIFYTGSDFQPSREITYKHGIFIVPFIIDASDPQKPVIDKIIMKKIMEIFNEYY